MDLTTNYLGLRLRSPLVPSASPLSAEIDNLLWMEDAGASAVVLPSLFEEQLGLGSEELHHLLPNQTNNFLETQYQNFRIAPDEYLNLIHKVREKIEIPIIASFKGCSLDGWTDNAKMLEQAGAAALELNIYSVHTDPELTSEQIEQNYINILKVVKAAVQIPVVMKLSPYFTNMANMAKRLDDAGADGLVLFNRFYQPDINLETLEVQPHVLLSTPQAMRLPLRWIAILYGRINAHLAATSGIHNAHDVLKMLMAGANITMLCSVLLRHGIDHIRCIEQEMHQWMEKHEYESVQQFQGSMSQKHCPNPSAFEHAQYMRALQTYQPEWGRVY